jgi:hypothetical protein
MVSTRFVFAAIGFCAIASVAAADDLLRWAGNSLSSPTGGPPVPALLGPPDSESFTGPYVYAGRFGSPASNITNATGLASLLGVSRALLERADVIAFELNGGSPAASGGWESARFTFAAVGSSPVIVNWSELIGAPTPPEVLANGSISGDAYKAFFGFSATTTPVISFIIFDVPTVNKFGTAFSVTIQSGASVGLPGEGTPDPDAVAVVDFCPCTADFDASGGTPDTSDIDAYFTAWLAGNPAADADCSGGTPDVSDIDVFFDAWLNGGC